MHKIKWVISMLNINAFELGVIRSFRVSKCHCLTVVQRLKMLLILCKILRCVQAYYYFFFAYFYTFYCTFWYIWRFSCTIFWKLCFDGVRKSTFRMSVLIYLKVFMKVPSSGLLNLWNLSDSFISFPFQGQRLHGECSLENWSAWSNMLN